MSLFLITAPVDDLYTTLWSPHFQLTDGYKPCSFSMQVMNANYPVTALHVSTDGGQRWEATVRRDYNYFERDAKGGFGQDRVLVRVTCSNGRQVILPDVNMAEYAESKAPANC